MPLDVVSTHRQKYASLHMLKAVMTDTKRLYWYSSSGRGINWVKCDDISGLMVPGVCA